MTRHDITPGPRGATPVREALDERKAPPGSWAPVGGATRVPPRGTERQGAR